MIEITPNLQTWLEHGERGSSSETMAEVFAGMPLGTITGRFGRGRHPHDPADFRRCLSLLQACPEFTDEQSFNRLKDISPVWKRMVENWQTMADLYRAEYQARKFPKLYAFMHELIYEKPFPRNEQ